MMSLERSALHPCSSWNHPSRPARSLRTVFILLAAMAQAGWPGPARAQGPDSKYEAPNGPVFAVARSGNTVYIGGDFSTMVPDNGGGAALDLSTGYASIPFPKIDGSILCFAPDGAGGWYIGGSFTAVGGARRSNLAHVLADGSVAPWCPNANANVDALVLEGGTVYVGGEFGMIAGEPRSFIAALDAVTGAATTWNPTASGTAVYSMAIDGRTMYVGGWFTFIGGGQRDNLAALSLDTGRANAWGPGTDYRVWAVVVHGTTVYAGGAFSMIGGLKRNGLAALDKVTGAVSPWDPQAVDSPYTGLIYTLAVRGTTVYAGGYFGSIGGRPRNGLAAIDSTTGAATAWDPTLQGADGGGVFSLALSGSTLYAGGNFGSMGGTRRAAIAALDLETGTATSWNPGANDAVWTVAVSGSAVCAGGYFSSIGTQPRNCLAAFDATTGRLEPWNPNPNGPVYALTAMHSRMYVGGFFTALGGQSRNHIAAFDSTTGIVSTWNPGADGPVYALAATDSTVYLGGQFHTAGGAARNEVAGIDAVTGTATAWNPGVIGSAVRALAISGPDVYIGGQFTTAGGQARRNIAALDCGTGVATAWNPQADSTVWALALSDTTVFAGGSFTHIGGQARAYLAALGAGAGVATPWVANASSSINEPGIYALVADGTTLYAAGGFDVIGGKPRGNLAAIEAASGSVLAWHPNADYLVNSLAVSGSTVYAGGLYLNFNGQGQHPHFAALPASGYGLRSFSQLLPADADSTFTVPPSVTWRAAPRFDLADPVTYVVYWSEAPSFVGADSAGAGQDTTLALAPRAFKTYHLYHWKVRAYDPYGLSSWSSPPGGSSFCFVPVTAMVYPGDANNDGVVDARDILPLGYCFGLSGPVRRNRSLGWEPQPLFGAWTGRAGAAFADCDGDGTVEADDIRAVIQNWGARKGQPAPADSDQVTVCQELLRAIDDHAQAPGMAAIRAAVADYLRKLTGPPVEFRLAENRPNPFRGRTTWLLSAPVATAAQLAVFDPRGRLIWRSLLPHVPAGRTPIVWDGDDLRGHRATSGVYYYKLSAGRYRSAGKTILLR